MARSYGISSDNELPSLHAMVSLRVIVDAQVVEPDYANGIIHLDAEVVKGVPEYCWARFLISHEVLIVQGLKCLAS
jgi:hypothetical protein